MRRPVDYRNLRAEELGSVYESLLELHPELNGNAHTFALKSAAGSERKTTGSYYTHPSLVNALIESALMPVLEQRIAEAIRGSDFGIGGSGKAANPESRTPNHEPQNMHALRLDLRYAVRMWVKKPFSCFSPF